MKLYKKIFSIMICICMVISFAACKNDQGAKEDELKITFWNAGFGSEWLDKTVEAYKINNPNAKIITDPNSNLSAGFIETRLKNNSGLSDIYFTSTGPAWGRWTLPSTSYLSDLTEVYDTDIDGILFKDKLLDGYNEAARIDGKPYIIHWSSTSTGFIYNKTMLNANPNWKRALSNGEYPITMKEMFELCGEILQTRGAYSGVKPFVFPGINNYWDFITLTWWAQYSGLDAYQDFFKFNDKSVFYDDGKYEAYRQFEDIIIKNMEGTKTFISGSESKNNISAQLNFANGEAFMMPNGAWAEKEMGLVNNSSIELGFMPVPLICDSNGNVIAKEMSQVDITFDETATDFDESKYVVTESSGDKKYYPLINNTWSGYDIVIVPKNAKNKEKALDFLKYMATDEALEIYTKYTGSMRPFKYSPTNASSDLSNFSKKAIQVWEKSASAGTSIMQASSSKMITIAGLDIFNYGGNAYQYMWADVGAKTARQTFDHINAFLEDTTTGTTTIRGVWYQHRVPYGLPL